MDEVNVVDPVTKRVLFAHAELADPETGEAVFAAGFLDQLERLRLRFGRPMQVTSACRSAERNARIGGHPRSLHVYDRPHHDVGGCAAIDIAAGDGAYKRELAYLALDMGWSVGVSRSFLHLDRRDLAALRPAMFAYGGA